MSATIDRRNSRMVLALMVPVVPATGLGITVPHSKHQVETAEDDASAWDRPDYGEWSVLDRLRHIRHTNQQSRRVPYDDIYFCIGTGTSEPTEFVVAEAQSNRWRSAPNRTSPKILENVIRVPEPVRSLERGQTVSLTDVSAAVGEIRSMLSLSITELSAILDVKRPTIYSWLRGDSQPHPRNLNRISFLHQVSQRWDELSGRPLRRHLRHAFDENGTTLFVLLKKDELDFEEIEKHLQALAKLPASQKMRSMRELATEHGLSTEAHPDAEVIRDIESGRRLTND
ncbi:MAG: helix-turn-helix transcriptional regulator [Fuerstiella sp.]